MEMDSKEMYQKQAELKLQEISAKIDELKAKSDGLAAKKKQRYYKRIQKLQSQKDRLFERVQRIQQTSEDAWGEMKKGIEKSLKELEGGYDKAASKIKELVSS
jgi:multidrug resistance efflux pump